MRSFILALSIVALGVGPTLAKTKRAVTVAEVPTWGFSWAYTPAPWGANQPVVTYGPGNQRCVSILLQTPSRWWVPQRRCAVVAAQ
jgi:hypothetical protein